MSEPKIKVDQQKVSCSRLAGAWEVEISNKDPDCVYLDSMLLMCLPRYDNE